MGIDGRASRALAMAAFVAIGACGDLEEDTADRGDAIGMPFPTAPAVLPKKIRVDSAMTDVMLRGGEQITVAQVQDFLATKGSYLAKYVVGDRTAAQLIVDLSLDHGISPLYMLARIQSESSLVGSGSSRNLTRATGCGCPDGGVCDPKLSGFASQVDCAAALIEAYYDELDTDGRTRSGWRVGVAKRTLDGCLVTPVNQATAALFTYTPWVGGYAAGGCGRGAGVSLLAYIYYRYWAGYHWGTDPTPAGTAGTAAGGAI